MGHYKCPHCDGILEYLDYVEERTEYGSYYLPSTNNPGWGDHESSDSEGSGIEYTCPECDRGVHYNDLIYVEDEDAPIGEELPPGRVVAGTFQTMAYRTQITEPEPAIISPSRELVADNYPLSRNAGIVTRIIEANSEQ